jgi:hypothetical protein
MADAKATFRLEGEDGTAAAFRSALGNVQEFSEKATRLLRGAFGFEIVNIFAEQIKGIAELGDNLVKGAERAGIAQAQFNQLAAAFGEADVSVQSLSKGIKNMEVAISKGANGDTTIASAFNDIGLSAESLKRLAPDVQLLAIAEAMSKIEDPSDRARIGTTILGKSFLELEPVLAKGAAGLDELVRAANGMDAETSEKLAKFNEQINHLTAGLKNWAANDVAYFADSLKQFHDFFAPDTATRIEQIQRMLSSPGNWGEDRVALLRKELKDLQSEWSDSSGKGPNANVSAALDEQGKGKIEALKNSLDEMDKLWTGITGKWAAERKKQLDEEDKQTQTIGDKRIHFEEMVNDLFNAGRINRSEAFHRDDAEENKRLDAAAKAQNTAAISDSIRESTDSMRESYRLMSEDARIAGENNRRMFDQTGQYAVQTGQLVEATFANAFLSIGQGGLRGLVANFVHAFATIVANAEAMDLAKAMGLQDAFSNQGGGSALGGIFSGLKSFFGGGSSGDSTSVWFNGDMNAGLPAYANGGSFGVGGSGGTDSQLVAFRATPGEQVSIKTPGQQGGVTVVNHNYIDARTDSTQIAQMIQASTQRAVQQSKAEVIDLIKRGAFAS